MNFFAAPAQTDIIPVRDAHSVNPILGLPYSDAEWIYGISSVILFRFRHGTLRQFWYFMLAIAIAGFAGLVIEQLS